MFNSVDKCAAHNIESSRQADKQRWFSGEFWVFALDKLCPCAGVNGTVTLSHQPDLLPVSGAITASLKDLDYCVSASYSAGSRMGSIMQKTK